jgi:anhydro-N-acetylmuramic acid kinase
MDGIDVSAILISDNGYISEIGNFYLPYDSAFKIKCRRAEFLMQESKGSPKSDLEFIKSFEAELTHLHIDAVRFLINKLKLDSKSITAIGFHGQTLYHNPEENITIQLGDGALMVGELGIKVINNFRSKDVANGGQGAPLVPIFHLVLAKQQNLIPLAIINCGGISNITIIPTDSEFDMLGFDTGPGNVLIDRYIREKTNGAEFYDLNGKYGEQGVVNTEVLDLLFTTSIGQNDYFNKKYPKSLCSSDIYLPDIIFDLSIYDASRTLEVFTAETIYNSCSPDIENFILVGGGWHNPIIKDSFKEKMFSRNPEVRFLEPEILGWNIDSMEASAFAYFAYRYLNNLPISFPNTTGVSKALVCGEMN